VYSSWPGGRQRSRQARKVCESVEREEPETGAGAGEESASNVVRLPRDWLGPRDKLVPFGPRAQSSGAADDRKSGETDGLNSDWPPGAADFWGEGSAAVQHALQGPGDVSERSAQDTGRRGPARAARAVSWLVGRGRALAAATGFDARSLPMPLPAVALFIVGILAIAFVEIGGGGSRPGTSARNAGGETAGAGGLAVVLPSLMFRGEAPHRSRPVSTSHDSHRRAQMKRERTRSRSSSGKHSSSSRAVPAAPRADPTTEVATSQPARTQSSTPVSTTVGGSSSSPAGTVAPSSDGGGSSGGGSSSGESSGGGGGGPVGPGAPFGPGHLG
jgi:hypothetical protein